MSITGIYSGEEGRVYRYLGWVHLDLREPNLQKICPHRLGGCYTRGLRSLISESL